MGYVDERAEDHHESPCQDFLPSLSSPDTRRDTQSFLRTRGPSLRRGWSPATTLSKSLGSSTMGRLLHATRCREATPPGKTRCPQSDPDEYGPSRSTFIAQGESPSFRVESPTPSFLFRENDGRTTDINTGLRLPPFPLVLCVNRGDPGTHLGPTGPPRKKEEVRGQTLTIRSTIP